MDSFNLRDETISFSMDFDEAVKLREGLDM